MISGNLVVEIWFKYNIHGAIGEITYLDFLVLRKYTWPSCVYFKFMIQKYFFVYKRSCQEKNRFLFRNCCIYSWLRGKDEELISR